MEDVPPSVDDPASTLVPAPPCAAVQRKSDEDTSRAPVRTGDTARRRRRSRHGDRRGRVGLHHEGHPSNDRSAPRRPALATCNPRYRTSSEGTTASQGSTRAQSEPHQGAARATRGIASMPRSSQAERPEGRTARTRSTTRSTGWSVCWRGKAARDCVEPHDRTEGARRWPVHISRELTDPRVC